MWIGGLFVEANELFLDLVRFKLVNDRHGHLIGSQALRQLSQVLGQCVRQVDTLARYGGDEFAVILENTGRPEAEAVLEKIYNSFAQPFVIGDSKVAARIGSAAFFEPLIGMVPRRRLPPWMVRQSIAVTL